MKWRSLDYGKLLAQMRDKPARVRRLLEIAVDELRNATTQMRDCVACGDFEAAFKVAHFVKGTAGQIMAGDLRERALRAEEIWRRGASVDRQQLGGLMGALDELVAEIDQYLGEQPSQPA